MPFDSIPTKTLTREDKLNRLLYHLDHATDREQLNYCSCLAHRCYADPILQDAGLPKQFWFQGQSPEEEKIWHSQLGIKYTRTKQWMEFFDFTKDEMNNVFGTVSIEYKKNYIKKILKSDYS